jgi:hypothetical protein
MVYQLLVDGKKVGQYSLKASPAKTATKIAKEIYEDQKMDGAKTFDFSFVKNRTKAEGGDKLYKFRARITPTPEPPIGTKEELIYMLKNNFQRVVDEANTNPALAKYLKTYAKAFGGSGWFLQKYKVEVKNLARIN